MKSPHDPLPEYEEALHAILHILPASAMQFLKLLYIVVHVDTCNALAPQPSELEAINTISEFIKNIKVKQKNEPTVFQNIFDCIT